MGTATKFVKAFQKISELLTPVLIGYEINEQMSDDKDREIIKYVEKSTEVSKNLETDNIMKNTVICAVIVFFLILFGIKKYLKYKKSVAQANGRINPSVNF